MPAANVSNEKNPDSWVIRNPAAWRHGKWNQETPINDLDAHGFVTPNDLFFIRSHGPVPRMPSSVEDFVVEFRGNLGNPVDLTLKQIQEHYVVRQVWSCLVCSGQRRYELNLIKKGVGHIDWHNAVGNALWTGVSLRDILVDLDVDQNPEKTQHVEFVGVDNYATSTPFHKCLDPNGDVLLCWMMNNEPLPPDHGYPLRVLIPGYSSKCSCKWVKRINVQLEETAYLMHHRYYKWFPPHIVDSSTQLQEMLEVPAVTELNTNCVIFQPRNNAPVREGPLRVTGYAFTGGGRPLARVEISVDGGQSWSPAQVARQELTPGKRLYSWVLWEANVVISRQVHTEVIARAWDCAANGMNQEPVWNLTGMMNNCWFRVKQKNYRWVHPTTWMNPEATTKKPFDFLPGDFMALDGEWEMGDNVPSITLRVAGQSFQSTETLFGGKALTGRFTGAATIESTFGAFFTVTGQVSSKGIEWNNGAKWYKL